MNLKQKIGHKTVNSNQTPYKPVKMRLKVQQGEKFIKNFNKSIQ